MNVQGLLPLLLFSLVATGTPGAATTLATASGANFGFRSSLPMIAGLAAGLGIVACAAAAGLGALLAAAPMLQVAMKAAGSLYLLWLALRVARSASPKAASQDARPTGFAAGILLLLYNPKAWAMTTSAAASFAGLAEGPVGLAAILGTTFCIVAGASLMVWCSAGQMLGRLLKTDKQWRFLNFLLAVALGISLVLIWL